MNRLLRIIVSLMFSALFAGSLAAQPLPRSVLIIDELGPGLPWYVALSGAFQTTLNARSTTSVSVYAENLDLNRFGSPEYEKTLRNYFRDKYQGRPIDVIVASGSSALDFVLRSRAGLWTGVPLIFATVSEAVAAKLKLPPDVTGTTMRHTLADMVSTARILVPNLKQIALVGDPLERNSFWHEFKDELAGVTTDLRLLDLTGLPMTELRRRTVALPDDTAILYTGIYIDGAGVGYIPRDALVAIAEVANRPIVIDADTYVGQGAVGGFIVDPRAIGQAAAELTLRILNGESATNIPVAVGNFNKPVFDWRQLKRWNVSENRLPRGSEIRFREMTAWERYQPQIIAIGIALMLQAGLIIGLVVEHWRRRQAEEAVRQSLSEALRLEELRAAQDHLVQAEKLSSLGQLTEGIAHEINSPVGTSLTIASTLAERCNAFADEQSSGQLRRSQLTEFIESNRDAANQLVENLARAGGLVQSFKQVATNHAHLDRHLFDLKSATDQMLASLRSTLGTFDGTIKIDIPDGIVMNSYPGPYGQVLTNLFLNAVTHGLDEAKDGSITIKARQLNDQQVEMHFSDDGKGMSEVVQRKAFDPFFTTRRSRGQTGLGLHIAYNIVTQQLGGQITLRSEPGQGAAFIILLPVFSPG
jgi:signal transduction histidine kinase